MTIGIDHMPQQKIARTAGLLYLIYIVTYASSSFLQNKPIGQDAPATARNIMASTWLFRIGFISEVIATLFFLLVAWLYMCY
jgi:hypothetical protein